MKNQLISIYIYNALYNDVNATRAGIGRCPWSIRVQMHGWRHRKFVFLVLFKMTRGFEKCLWNNFGLSKRKPRKNV